MIDKEDVKRAERAIAYTQMIQSWAWKDFEANVLNDQRQSALEEMLTDNSNLEKLRGIVKCIDGIKGDLAYIVGE